jgi:hypothetical protein
MVTNQFLPACSFRSSLSFIRLVEIDSIISLRACRCNYFNYKFFILDVLAYPCFWTNAVLLYLYPYRVSVIIPRTSIIFV